MRTRSLFAVVTLGLMLIISGAPARAQDMGKFTLFGGYSFQSNKLFQEQGSNLFLCEFIGAESCAFGSSTGLHGYTGSVVYNANSHIGIEANFAGHNGSQTTFDSTPTANTPGLNEKFRQDDYTYTFGPKFSIQVGHFSLFTHFLLGAAHAHGGSTLNETPDTSCNDCTPTTFTSSNSGNGFALRTGGGMDWTHGRLSVRVVQVDLVHEELGIKGSCDNSCEGDIAFGSFHYRTSLNNIEVATGVTLTFGGKR